MGRADQGEETRDIGRRGQGERTGVQEQGVQGGRERFTKGFSIGPP